uniref:RdRp catalytic domain-containing protein n=1 Tax=Frankliniella occidentalis flavi-like virus 1 TaxID=2767259 RepID=A0A7G9IR66_9FLAV|nr:hypothetical protein [Frankliniella occidentalis flavi-like virus 1]
MQMMRRTMADPASFEEPEPTPAEELERLKAELSKHQATEEPSEELSETARLLGELDDLVAELGDKTKRVALPTAASIVGCSSGPKVNSSRLVSVLPRKEKVVVKLPHGLKVTQTDYMVSSHVVDTKNATFAVTTVCGKEISALHSGARPGCVPRGSDMIADPLVELEKPSIDLVVWHRTKWLPAQLSGFVVDFSGTPRACFSLTEEKPRLLSGAAVCNKATGKLVCVVTASYRCYKYAIDGHDATTHYEYDQCDVKHNDETDRDLSVYGSLGIVCDEFVCRMGARFPLTSVKIDENRCHINYGDVYCGQASARDLLTANVPLLTRNAIVKNGPKAVGYYSHFKDCIITASHLVAPDAENMIRIGDLCIIGKDFGQMMIVAHEICDRYTHHTYEHLQPGDSGKFIREGEHLYIHAGEIDGKKQGVLSHLLNEPGFIHHSAESSRCKPSGFNWGLIICLICSFLAITSAASSTRIDSQAEKKIQCLISAEGDLTLSAVLKKCGLNDEYRVLDEGLLNTKRVNWNDQLMKKLEKVLDVHVKRVQEISNMLNDPAFVTMTITDRYQREIIKMMGESSFASTLISALGKDAKGAQNRLMELQNNENNLRGLRVTLNDTRSLLSDSIARYTIAFHKLSVASKQLEDVVARLENVSNALSLIIERLRRQPMYHPSDMASVPLPSIDMATAATMMQVANIETRISELAPKAAYKYEIVGGRYTLIDTAKPADVDIVPLEVSVTHSMPSNITCNANYVLNRTECYTHNSWTDAVDCEYTSVLHRDWVMRLSNKGRVYASLTVPECFVTAIANRVGVKSSVVLNTCSHEHEIGNLTIHCFKKGNNFFRGHALVSPVYEYKVHVGTSFRKAAFILVAVFVCWAVAEYAGSTPAGIILFLGLVTFGHASHCNSSMLVKYAKYVESTDEYVMYSAMGQFSIGSCVRCGNSTLTMEAAHNTFDYVKTGEIAYDWQIAQHTDYGCPGGKSESVCNTTQLPLQSHVVRIDDCVHTYGSMWAGTKCATDGQVYVHVTLDFHINETVELFARVIESSHQTLDLHLAGPRINKILNLRVPDTTEDSGVTLESFTMAQVDAPQWILVRTGRDNSKEYMMAVTDNLPDAPCKVNLARNSFVDWKCPIVDEQQTGGSVKYSIRSPLSKAWYNTDRLQPLSSMYGDSYFVEREADVMSVSVQSSSAYMRILARDPIVSYGARLCTIKKISVNKFTEGIIGALATSTVTFNVPDVDYCYVRVHDGHCWVQGDNRLYVQNNMFTVTLLCGVLVDSKLTVDIAGGTVDIDISSIKLARNFEFGLNYAIESVIAKANDTGLSSVSNFFGEFAGKFESMFKFGFMRVFEYAVIVLVIFAALFMFMSGRYVIAGVFICVAAIGLVPLASAEENWADESLYLNISRVDYRESFGFTVAMSMIVTFLTCLLTSDVVAGLSLWMLYRVLIALMMPSASRIRTMLVDAVSVIERVSMTYVIALEFFDKLFSVLWAVVLYYSFNWQVVVVFFLVKEVPMIYSVVNLMFRGKVYSPSPCYWRLAEVVAGKWFRPAVREGVVPSNDMHDTRRNVQVRNPATYRPSLINANVVNHTVERVSLFSILKGSHEIGNPRRNIAHIVDGKRLFYYHVTRSGVIFGAYHCITFDIAKWTLKVENDFFCCGPNEDDVQKVFALRKKMRYSITGKKFTFGDSGKYIECNDGTFYIHRGSLQLPNPINVSVMFGSCAVENHSGDTRRAFIERTKAMLAAKERADDSNLVRIAGLAVDKAKVADKIVDKTNFDINRDIAVLAKKNSKTAWCAQLKRIYDEIDGRVEIWETKFDKVDLYSSVYTMLKRNPELLGPMKQAISRDYVLNMDNHASWPNELNERAISLYNNFKKSAVTNKVRDLQQAKREFESDTASSVSDYEPSAPPATEVEDLEERRKKFIARMKVHRGELHEKDSEIENHTGHGYEGVQSDTVRADSVDIESVYAFKIENHMAKQRLNVSELPKEMLDDMQDAVGVKISAKKIVTFYEIMKGSDIHIKSEVDEMLDPITCKHEDLTSEEIIALADAICIKPDYVKIKALCCGESSNSTSVTTPVTPSDEDGPETVAEMEINSFSSINMRRWRDVINRMVDDKIKQIAELDTSNNKVVAQLSGADERLGARDCVYFLNISGVWGYLQNGFAASCYHCLYKRPLTITLPENGPRWMENPSFQRFSRTFGCDKSSNIDELDICVYRLTGDGDAHFARDPVMNEICVVINPKLNAFFFVQCRMVNNTNGITKNEHLFVVIGGQGQVLSNISNTKGWSGLPILSFDGEVLGLFGTIVMMNNRFASGTVSVITTSPIKGYLEQEEARPRLDFSSTMSRQVADIIVAAHKAHAEHRRIRVTAPTGWGKTTRLPLLFNRAFVAGKMNVTNIVVLIPQRIACERAAERTWRTIEHDKEFADTGVVLNIGNQDPIRWPMNATRNHNITFCTYGKYVASGMKNTAHYDVGGSNLLILDEVHIRECDVLLVEAILLTRGINYIALTATTFDYPAYEDMPIGTFDIPKYSIVDHTLAILGTKTDESGYWVIISNGRSYGVPRDCWDGVKQMLVFIADKAGCDDCAAKWNQKYPKHRATAFYRGVPLDDTALVIFATKVAQVSLTLPNLVTVVDFRDEYRPTLEIEFKQQLLSYSVKRVNISREDMTQRRGRVGRVAHGHYVYLERGILSPAEAFPTWEVCNVAIKLWQQDLVPDTMMMTHLMFTYQNMNPLKFGDAGRTRSMRLKLMPYCNLEPVFFYLFDNLLDIWEPFMWNDGGEAYRELAEKCDENVIKFVDADEFLRSSNWKVEGILRESLMEYISKTDQHLNTDTEIQSLRRFVESQQYARRQERHFHSTLWAGMSTTAIGGLAALWLGHHLYGQLYGEAKVTTLYRLQKSEVEKTLRHMHFLEEHQLGKHLESSGPIFDMFNRVKGTFVDVYRKAVRHLPEPVRDACRFYHADDFYQYFAAFVQWAEKMAADHPSVLAGLCGIGGVHAIVGGWWDFIRKHLGPSFASLLYMVFSTYTYATVPAMLNFIGAGLGCMLYAGYHTYKHWDDPDADSNLVSYIAPNAIGYFIAKMMQVTSTNLPQVAIASVPTYVYAAPAVEASGFASWFMSTKNGFNGLSIAVNLIDMFSSGEEKGSLIKQAGSVLFTAWKTNWSDYREMVAAIMTVGVYFAVNTAYEAMNERDTKEDIAKKHSPAGLSDAEQNLRGIRNERINRIKMVYDLFVIGFASIASPANLGMAIIDTAIDIAIGKDHGGIAMDKTEIFTKIRFTICADPIVNLAIVFGKLVKQGFGTGGVRAFFSEEESLNMSQAATWLETIQSYLASCCWSVSYLVDKFSDWFMYPFRWICSLVRWMFGMIRGSAHAIGKSIGDGIWDGLVGRVPDMLLRFFSFKEKKGADASTFVALSDDSALTRALLRYGCNGYFSSLLDKMDLHQNLCAYVKTKDIEALRLINTFGVSIVGSSVDDFSCGIGAIACKELKKYYGIEHGFAFRVLCSPYMMELQNQRKMCTSIGNSDGVYKVGSQILQFNNINGRLVGMTRNVHDNSNIIVAQFTNDACNLIIGGFNNTHKLIEANPYLVDPEDAKVLNEIMRTISTIASVNNQARACALKIFDGKTRELLKFINEKVICIPKDVAREVLGMIMKVSVKDSDLFNDHNVRAFLKTQFNLPMLPSDVKLSNVTKSIEYPSTCFRFVARQVLHSAIRARVSGIPSTVIEDWSPMVLDDEDPWTVFWLRMDVQHMKDVAIGHYLATFMRCTVGVPQDCIEIEPLGGVCCNECYVSIEDRKVTGVFTCPRKSVSIYNHRMQSFEFIDEKSQARHFNHVEYGYWRRVFRKIRHTTVHVNVNPLVPIGDVFTTESRNEALFIVINHTDGRRSNLEPKSPRWMNFAVLVEDLGSVQVTNRPYEDQDNFLLFVINQKSDVPTKFVMMDAEGCCFITEFGFKLAQLVYGDLLTNGYFVVQLTKEACESDDGQLLKDVVMPEPIVGRHCHDLREALQDGYARLAFAEEVSEWNEHYNTFQHRENKMYTHRMRRSVAHDMSLWKHRARACSVGLEKILRSQADALEWLSLRTDNYEFGTINAQALAGDLTYRYCLTSIDQTNKFKAREAAQNDFLLKAGLTTIGGKSMKVELMKSSFLGQVRDVKDMLSSAKNEGKKNAEALNRLLIPNAETIEKSMAEGNLSGSEYVEAFNACRKYVRLTKLPRTKIVSYLNALKRENLLLCYLWYDIEEATTFMLPGEDYSCWNPLFKDKDSSVILSPDNVEIVANNASWKLPDHGAQVNLSKSWTSLGKFRYKDYLADVYKTPTHNIIVPTGSNFGFVYRFKDYAGLTEFMAKCPASVLEFAKFPELDDIWHQVNLVSTNPPKFGTTFHSNVGFWDTMCNKLRDWSNCNDVTVLTKPWVPTPKEEKEMLPGYLWALKTIKSSDKIDLTDMHLNPAAAQLYLSEVGKTSDREIRKRIRGNLSCVAVHFDGVSRRQLDWTALKCPHVDVLKGHIADTNEKLSDIEGKLRNKAERLEMGPPIVPIKRGDTHVSDCKVPYEMLKRVFNKFGFIKTNDSNRKLWELIKRKDRVYLPPGPNPAERSEGCTDFESRGAYKAALFDRDTGLITLSQTIWDLTAGQGGFVDYAMLAGKTGKVVKRVIANTLHREGHSLPNLRSLLRKAESAGVEFRFIASSTPVGKEVTGCDNPNGLKGAGDIRQEEVLNAMKFATFGLAVDADDDKHRPDFIVFDAGESNDDFRTESRWLTINHKMYNRREAKPLVTDGSYISTIKEALPHYLNCLAQGGTALIKMMGFNSVTEEIVRYLVNGEGNSLYHSIDSGCFKHAFAWKSPTSTLLSREWYLVLTGYTRHSKAKKEKKLKIDVDYLMNSLRAQWYNGLKSYLEGCPKLWNDLAAARRNIDVNRHADFVPSVIAKEYFGLGVAGMLFGQQTAEKVGDVKVPMKFVAYPKWDATFKLPESRDLTAINQRVTAFTSVKQNYGCDRSFELDGIVFNSRIEERVGLVKQVIHDAGRRLTAPSGLFKNICELGKLSGNFKYANEKHHANAIVADAMYSVFGLTYLNAAVGHTNATEEKVRASLVKRVDLKPNEPSPADRQRLLDAAIASTTPEYWRIANGPDSGKFRFLSFEEAKELVHNQGKGGKFDTYVNLKEAVADPNFKVQVMELYEKCLRGESLSRYETLRVKNETKAKKIAGNGKLELDPSIDPNSHEFKGVKKVRVTQNLEQLYQRYKETKDVAQAPISEVRGFVSSMDAYRGEGVLIKFHSLDGNYYADRIPSTFDLEVKLRSRVSPFFEERDGNVLDFKGDIAHCISRDLKMSAGIAKDFVKLFGNELREKLATQNPRVGDALSMVKTGRRIHFLVTKEVYHAKPTLETVRSALESLATNLKKRGVYEVAMPKIACGLDSLEYEDVRRVIADVATKSKVNMIVYLGFKHREVVLHHTHICDDCKCLYRHEHTGVPRPHPQRGNQCPNPKCRRYYGVDREGLNNANPTNAVFIREALKVGELFWTQEPLSEKDLRKIRVLNVIARASTSDGLTYDQISGLFSKVSHELSKVKDVKHIFLNQIGSGDNYLAWEKVKSVYAASLLKWYKSRSSPLEPATITVGLGKERSIKDEAGKTGSAETVLRYEPELFFDPHFMEFVREHGGKDPVRELRLKVLHEASKIMPRAIQFCDMANRVLDIMFFGQMQEHHNKVEKLYTGSTTGTPLWMLGNAMKAADDFFCNTAEQEFIRCSNKGGHYKDPVLIHSYDPKHKEGYDRCREKEYTRKVLCGDFSGFDGTVHLTDHAICHIMDRKIYREECHLALKTRTEHVMWSIIITDDGYVVVRQGQRGSGDRNTSYGNTFINQYTHIAAIAVALGITASEAAKPLGEIWYKAKFDGTPLAPHESMVDSNGKPNAPVLKRAGFKRIYITRITNFNDGDDNVHFGHIEDLNALNTKGVKFIERTNKMLRCGTKSGYAVVSKFEHVSFCSHGFERVRIGTVNVAGEFVGLSACLPIYREAEVNGVSKEDRSRLGYALQSQQHEADHICDYRIAYLPTRPLPEIVGKLTFTMKATTTEVDLSRDYGKNVSGLKFGMKNEEKIALTRGKILAYILNYIHILPVRQICLALLSTFGDGACDMTELRRRYHVPTIMGSWQSAIRSVFSVKSMDEIECLGSGYDRKGLRLMAYNTRMTYEDLITPQGKVCPPTPQSLSVKLMEWLDSVEHRHNIKVDWKIATACDAAVLCKVGTADASKVVEEELKVLRKPRAVAEKKTGLNLLLFGMAALSVLAPRVSQWDGVTTSDFFVVTNREGVGLRQLDKRLGLGGSMYKEMRTKARFSGDGELITCDYTSVHDGYARTSVVHALVAPAGSSTSSGGSYGTAETSTFKLHELIRSIDDASRRSFLTRRKVANQLRCLKVEHESVHVPHAIVLVSYRGYMHRFKISDVATSLKTFKVNKNTVPYQHLSGRYVVQ